MEVSRPSQGLNPSHSCDLCHRCSNAGSFNPLYWAREQICASTATGPTTIALLTHCASAGIPVLTPLTFSFNYFSYQVVLIVINCYFPNTIFFYCTVTHTCMETPQMFIDR